MLDPDPHQSDKLDPDLLQLLDSKTKCMEYGFIWALFMVLSHYFEARSRIRIRIKVKGRIRIRFKVTSRIRIRIKIQVRRIRNTVRGNSRWLGVTLLYLYRCCSCTTAPISLDSVEAVYPDQQRHCTGGAIDNMCWIFSDNGMINRIMAAFHVQYRLFLSESSRIVFPSLPKKCILVNPRWRLTRIEK